MPTKAELNQAIYEGNTTLVEALLKFPNIIETIANEDTDALSIAVERGHLDIVKLLLKQLKVVDAISLHDHYALTKSLEQNHFDIAVEVLKSYGKTPIPFSIIEKIQAIDPSNEYAQKLKSQLFQRVMMVKWYYSAGSEKAKWLNAWISYWKLEPWPQGVSIHNIPVSQYLFEQSMRCSEPAQAAILLLSLNANAQKYKVWRTGMQKNGVHSRNYMMFNDENYFAIFNRVYQELIEPEFRQKFDEAGGLSGVENMIKKAILDKIEPIDEKKLFFPYPYNYRLSKAELIHGTDDVVKFARGYAFYKPHDPNHKAWRAVNDPYRTLGVRRMIAYYYLVAIDQRLTVEQRAKATDAFWTALELIQNPHQADCEMPLRNEGACIPILHNVVAENPFFIKPAGDFDRELKDAIKEELKKELPAVFVTCDADQAQALLDATTVLRAETAAYFVSRVPRPIDEEMLNTRQNFILTFLCGKAGSKPLFERLQEAMLKNYKILLINQDVVFVYSLLADIGGWDAQADIKAAYDQRIAALRNNNGQASGLVQMSVAPTGTTMTEGFSTNALHKKPRLTANTSF